MMQEHEWEQPSQVFCKQQEKYSSGHLGA